jgi:hemolysin type calcium-binding protein
MTAVHYLHKSDLHEALNTSDLSSGAQNAIIQQLITDGLYSASSNAPKIWVESDIFKGVAQTPFFDSSGGPGPDPGILTQLLEVEGQNVTVHTDSTLKVIVDDGDSPGPSGFNKLTVTGGAYDQFIVLGKTSTKVMLQDLGNDTVLGGSGDDTIDASANGGNDSLIAGKGNDLLIGGSGQDTLIGGSGHDTLIAGTGHGSLLQAGSGATVITDLSSGGYDTLVAGTGKDTITGQQGDFFDTVAGSGHDVYAIYDGHGDSTINLLGNDTVNFHTTAATTGKDIINNGGGGVDTVDFTSSANHSFASISSITEGTGSSTGDWTIKFNNGQSVTLNGHLESGSKDAFVLKFDGVTVHLQGGS